MQLALPLDLHHWLTLSPGSCGDDICEFTSADDPPVNADPAFKARLRRELWQMLRGPDSHRG